MPTEVFVLRAYVACEDWCEWGPVWVGADQAAVVARFCAWATPANLWTEDPGGGWDGEAETYGYHLFGCPLDGDAGQHIGWHQWPMPAREGDEDDE